MTELQSLKSDVKQYAEVTARLAAHSLIRSHNKPQGDIAEAIAAEAFGGTLLDQSAKGADVKLPDGKLLQVKSVTDYGKATQTSAIRSTDFDQLLLVVFDPAIAVESAHSTLRNKRLKPWATDPDTRTLASFVCALEPFPWSKKREIRVSPVSAPWGRRQDCLEGSHSAYT